MYLRLESCELRSSTRWKSSDVVRGIIPLSTPSAVGSVCRSGKSALRCVRTSHHRVFSQVSGGLSGKYKTTYSSFGWETRSSASARFRVCILSYLPVWPSRQNSSDLTAPKRHDMGLQANTQVLKPSKLWFSNSTPMSSYKVCWLAYPGSSRSPADQYDLSAP